jgi:lysylphosphatidylglycerol synthetase-like protein (DUF2156 family)
VAPHVRAVLNTLDLLVVQGKVEVKMVMLVIVAMVIIVMTMILVVQAVLVVIVALVVVVVVVIVAMEAEFFPDIDPMHPSPWRQHLLNGRQVAVEEGRPRAARFRGTPKINRTTIVHHHPEKLCTGVRYG